MPIRRTIPAEVIIALSVFILLFCNEIRIMGTNSAMIVVLILHSCRFKCRESFTILASMVLALAALQAQTNAPFASACTPALVACPDQSVAVGSLLNLMGIASGGVPTWSVLSTPPNASAPVFSNQNSPGTGVTFSTVGGYVLQLQVSNGSNSSISSVVVFADPANNYGVPELVVWQQSVGGMAGNMLSTSSPPVSGVDGHVSIKPVSDGTTNSCVSFPTDCPAMVTPSPFQSLGFDGAVGPAFPAPYYSDLSAYTGFAPPATGSCLGNYQAAYSYPQGILATQMYQGVSSQYINVNSHVPQFGPYPTNPDPNSNSGGPSMIQGLDFGQFPSVYPWGDGDQSRTVRVSVLAKFPTASNTDPYGVFNVITLLMHDSTHNVAFYYTGTLIHPGEPTCSTGNHVDMGTGRTIFGLCLGTGSDYMSTMPGSDPYVATKTAQMQLFGYEISGSQFQAALNYVNSTCSCSLSLDVKDWYVSELLFDTESSWGPSDSTMSFGAAFQNLQASVVPGATSQRLTIQGPPGAMVSPRQFSFSAVQGQGNPASQTLSISNAASTGSQSLFWNVASDSCWLSVTRAFGQTPYLSNSGFELPGGAASPSVTVSVDTSSLTPVASPYHGNVIVTSTDPTQPVTVFPVTLTFTGNPPLSQPSLSVTPKAYSFYTLPGTSPSPANLSISNLALAGGQNLQWAISNQNSWLSLDGTPGSSDGVASTSGQVAPQATLSPAATGTVNSTSQSLSGTVQLTSNDPNNAIVSIPVNLVVSTSCAAVFTGTTTENCSALNQQSTANNSPVSVGAPVSYYGAMTMTGNVAYGDAPGMALYNAGGGTSASVSLDFYTTSFNNSIPQAKIKSIDDGNYSNNLTFWTKMPGSPANGVAEVMRITSSGNVGMGTTNPTQPLQMGSGAYVSGGGVWTNASDRNLKENFAPVEQADILRKIDALSVMRWNYKNEDPSVAHIGPVAQDFYSIFGMGGSSTAISTIDPAGIALAGIQGLDQGIQKRVAKILELNQQIDLSNREVRSLEERLTQMETRIEQLNNR
jgi:hypothetical protein